MIALTSGVAKASFAATGQFVALFLGALLMPGGIQRLKSANDRPGKATLPTP